ncbi:hypothetical protein NDU88_010970 [Pleurodeles waltl]|uniref:Uncharacterized protein n=1 Tax=Pleurodeles waltl TaxID=8319 RepID=A0AAV7R1S7_PLEWA|nr:hypothetical protein NDU88_010970 [Pleurodeles waltl]
MPPGLCVPSLESLMVVRVDNRVAMSYINRQFGTGSSSINLHARCIMSWAQFHLVGLQAIHIQVVLNHQADLLIQVFPSSLEFILDPSVFNQICSRCTVPTVDLLATPLNAKLPLFSTRFLPQDVLGTDALTSPWHTGLLYTFNPISMIRWFLSRLLREVAEVVAVHPFWPWRPWFPLLHLLEVEPD